MSVERAKAFLELLKNDTSMRDRIIEADTPEKKLAVAKDAGYDFSGADLDEARGSLSEGDLDKVAGGGCGIHEVCKTDTHLCVDTPVCVDIGGGW